MEENKHKFKPGLRLIWHWGSYGSTQWPASATNVENEKAKCQFNQNPLSVRAPVWLHTHHEPFDCTHITPWDTTPYKSDLPLHIFTPLKIETHCFHGFSVKRKSLCVESWGARCEGRTGRYTLIKAAYPLPLSKWIMKVSFPNFSKVS